MDKSEPAVIETFYQELIGRLKVPGGGILTYEDVKQWPPGMRERLEKAGKIRQIEPAAEVICDQCESRCSIIPEVRTHPKTGEAVGVYVCPERMDIGRIRVDLDRRRRWEILGKIPDTIVETPELVEEELKRKKNRPTKREMENRNRSVLLIAAEIQSHNGRLATVEEIEDKTGFSKQQIYATAAYKEGRIQQAGAKATTEMTGSSVADTEYFSEKSEQHGRVRRRSKSQQAELDLLVEQQAQEKKSRYVK